jgi:hypothetical protein
MKNFLGNNKLTTMKPNEKAKELFLKYSKGKDEHGWNLCEFDSCAKQCALIAVDEIFKIYELLDEDADIMFKTELNYWNEVKKEIELL